MFKKKNKNPETARVRRPMIERDAPVSSVFSYHARRAARPGALGRQEQPAAARREQRFGWARRGPVIGLLILLAALATLNLFLSRTPQVVPVTDGGGAVFLRSSGTYEAAARDVLGRSFWNGNKLTINTERITTDLQGRFPELVHVTVSVPFAGNRIRVYVEPSSPQLLLSSGSEMYVLDTAGRALLSAKQVPHIEKLGLPVVTDQSGLPVRLGKPALPSTSVRFITEVAGQLKAKRISVSSLTLPQGTSEMDLRISGEPYFVKFNLRGDARVEVGAFLAVRDQLVREHKTPASYIDVRVEERAYYK